MQADKFTQRSHEAVADAQRLAAERRNPELAPAHLLLALLQQEDGLAPAVLRKLGADVGGIIARTRGLADDLPRLSEGATPDVRPSSNLVAALQRAEKEMSALGDEYISTEHILLALADSS